MLGTLNFRRLEECGTLLRWLDAVGFEVEEWKYILNTPLALRLVRFSWALDELRGPLGALETIGYGLLLAAYGMSRLRPEWLSGPAQHGLTLLVRARKVAKAA